MHNAPNTQRDYLFENEWGQETYQGQMDTGTTASTTPTETIDSLINPNEVEQVIGNTQTGTYTGIIYSWSINTGTQISQKTGTLITWSLDCITPWKEKVENKDFVLAYDQRKDVNTICNIQKRVCINWILGWSFTQRSCKDDVVYDYHKAEIVSYNQKVINEYIQPTPMTEEEKKAQNALIQPTTPKNEWATFTTEGKINTSEEQPTNTRGETNNPVTTQPEVNQTPNENTKSCTTSRGKKVQHGQFVKAYKAPRGFIDLPCDVQIRPCVNGVLKGSFIYSKCTFNNITYTDYLTAGSPKSSTWFLFFERIKSILKK